MSRKVTVFIVVLVVLILGGGLVTAQLGQSLVHTPGQSKIAAPAQVDAIAEDMFIVTPPPGYAGNYGVDLTEYKLAGYAPETAGRHLIVMQVNDWATLADAEIAAQAMDRLKQEYGVDRTGAAVVEQRTTTTQDGKEQAYTLVEGTGEDGTAYRAIYAIVPVWTGLAFLYFEEPAAAWNDATAAAVVASIRLPEL